MISLYGMLETVLMRGEASASSTCLMYTKTYLDAMGVKLLLSVSLIYFQVDRAGALGASPLLHYFRHYEIKNTDLIHCFWSLRAILTGLLLCTYIDAS